MSCRLLMLSLLIIMIPEEFYKEPSQQGFELTDTQRKQLERYFKLLVGRNQKINLTAITDEGGVYSKHSYDSVVPVLQGKMTNQAIRLLDIGAGAGFLSASTKTLHPDIDVTVTDSLNKRINFPNLLADELGLEGVHFYHGRAEDFGQDKHFRASYDIIITRAAARLQVLTELTIPFLKVGGQLIVLKAPAAEEELADAKNAMTVLFLKFIDNHHYELPNGDSRQIAILEEKKETPNKYPRRAGMPNKKPLQYVMSHKAPSEGFENRFGA